MFPSSGVSKTLVMASNSWYVMKASVGTTLILLSIDNRLKCWIALKLKDPFQSVSLDMNNIIFFSFAC